MLGRCLQAKVAKVPTVPPKVAAATPPRHVPKLAAQEDLVRKWPTSLEDPWLRLLWLMALGPDARKVDSKSLMQLLPVCMSDCHVTLKAMFGHQDLLGHRVSALRNGANVMTQERRHHLCWMMAHGRPLKFGRSDLICDLSYGKFYWLVFRPSIRESSLKTALGIDLI